MLMRIMANPNGNYLRARGEYSGVFASLAWSVELPPRTRRIPLLANVPQLSHGTTSAHAENTLGFIGDDGVYRNYLRARGEYSSPYTGLKL